MVYYSNNWSRLVIIDDYSLAVSLFICFINFIVMFYVFYTIQKLYWPTRVKGVLTLLSFCATPCVVYNYIALHKIREIKNPFILYYHIKIFASNFAV